jgi:hypothetical protein
MDREFATHSVQSQRKLTKKKSKKQKKLQNNINKIIRNNVTIEDEEESSNSIGEENNGLITVDNNATNSIDDIKQNCLADSTSSNLDNKISSTDLNTTIAVVALLVQDLKNTMKNANNFLEASSTAPTALYYTPRYRSLRSTLQPLVEQIADKMTVERQKQLKKRLRDKDFLTTKEKHQELDREYRNQTELRG